MPSPASSRPLTRRELREMAAAQAASDSTRASVQVEQKRDAAPAADPFETAARLFSFTGETPIQAAASDATAGDAPIDETVVDAAEEPTATGKRRAPRRTRPSLRSRGFTVRRVAATSASVASMAVVGLLAVGMTTPSAAVAEANFGAANAATATDIRADDDAEEIQAYIAPAEVQNVKVDRGEASYETASLRDLAAAEGVTTFSSLFTNDPTAAIQWPFMVGVPMSYGYGPRWGSMHTGIDLTPGNGAEIHAIADGVVRSASPATGGYGVNIYIDHIIDGKTVTSHYAHMQYGSMRVATGDTVKVGQVIGLVGNTGHSFGAHLHFEILLGGTQLIDPLPWMRENAGRHSLGN